MRSCIPGCAGSVWALASAALLVLTGSGVQAQLFSRQRCYPCPPAPCPPDSCAPAPSPTPPGAQPGQPAQPAQPGQEAPPMPLPGQPPSFEPTLGAEQASATAGSTVALAAPNMLGNLLGAGRSLSFFYQRTNGSIFINGTGSTNIANAKVADDNSPLPEDRVYFRYNFFSRSESVTGDTGAVFFDPTLGISALSQPRFRGITASKTYDVNEFTFGAEKTFFDGRFSAELRVPFQNTLASNLDLNVASITGIGRDLDGDSNVSIIQTTPTPQNTFGHSDTEWGNMTLIFKGLACRSSTFALSGGLGLGIPTGEDTKVSVTDFLGDAHDNDIEVLRERQFHVNNSTWSLSPFLATLWTPNDRFFAQGFLQVDIPLNRSAITYSEIALQNTEPNELSLTPLFVRDSIREQTLLQTDIGVGYWLFRDRSYSWITGIAPTIELHYTTTLENADIVVLPTAQKSANLAVVGANGQLIPEPNPTVGNLRNRVDILDMTVGTTFVVADRATAAFGVAFPLRQGDDRTFDWELQFQLNYYFGGPRYRERWVPPSF